MVILSGCPSQKEVQEIVTDISAKKANTMQVISTSDYSLDGLLKAQDYFFNFGEKISMVVGDPEGLKNLQRMVKKDGISKFCQNFVVPKRFWDSLEMFCKGGRMYRCSPDIKEYPNTLNKMLELLGPEVKAAFDQDQQCR